MLAFEVMYFFRQFPKAKSGDGIERFASFESFDGAGTQPHAPCNQGQCQGPPGAMDMP
jgi:hypothetical protein